MAKWECPNKAEVHDHPKKVLFEDNDEHNYVSAFVVPRPEYCNICKRWYTKEECKRADR